MRLSRRRLLLTAAGLALLPPGSYALGAPQQRPLARIAFGSCAGQDQEQPIWDTIVGAKPDLFLFIGDNIYADTTDMAEMRAKYAKLAAKPGYQRLKAACPILATWDDHDFGVNDGGREYPKRAESQQVFLDVFGEPKDSPRRKQEGVYDAKVFGPEDKRVQVILLDTRYHRSPLKRAVAPPRGQGPYVPDDDPNATMLGEAQWKWLEQQLRVPARVRVIASSIQVVPEDHGWEKWMNFPRERERLFRLIRDTKASGVFFVSGDRHIAELAVMDGGAGYPMYDLTSSSLNRSARRTLPDAPERNRVGLMNWGDNFGVIEVDWNDPDPLIRLQIRDVQGDVVLQRKVRLSSLQAK